MAIIGAILGDIAGSQYEFSRPNDLDWKHCELFTDRCYFTDDTVMTLATKLAVLNDCQFEKYYRQFGRQYPRDILTIDYIGLLKCNKRVIVCF